MKQQYSISQGICRHRWLYSIQSHMCLKAISKISGLCQSSIFSSAFVWSPYPALQTKSMAVTFFKNYLNNISSPTYSQKLATTPSRCGVVSLAFEPAQTFPSFPQGSVVEVNLFSLWVKCGLRNGFYWPMWRFSEFICIVK